jgi:hypothetical protein
VSLPPSLVWVLLPMMVVLLVSTLRNQEIRPLFIKTDPVEEPDDLERSGVFGIHRIYDRLLDLSEEFGSAEEMPGPRLVP